MAGFAGIRAGDMRGVFPGRHHAVMTIETDAKDLRMINRRLRHRRKFGRWFFMT